jgi:phosphopantothenoylcysteine decarboxylase / phosphopantothenate---cysteine ligase
MSLEGRRILIVIGGGIAAYKVLELIRRLKEAGANVSAAMSRSAHHFVTPLSVAAISGERVASNLFDLDEEHEIGHIRLSREADLIVVAPATADLLAKLANGLADDLASAVLLASDKPILAAPAMNPRMWSHPATQRNVERLRADGVQFVGPEAGEMAEKGEAGLGRLAEPAAILTTIERHFSLASGPLAGRRAIVTSGPTQEPIDPVRYIANRSSGRQGHAIAAALAIAGAKVTLVSGPVEVRPPPGVHTVPVMSAREMAQAVEATLPADIAIMAAAVADWRVEESAEKIKKETGGLPSLALVENPDILAGLSRHRQRPRLVVGFAAETENVIANAQAKLKRKGCDWILANDVSPGTGIMGGERNRVHFITNAGVEDWPDLSKTEVAARLVARIVRHFAQGPEAAAPAPRDSRATGTSSPAKEPSEDRPATQGSLNIRPTR